MFLGMYGITVMIEVNACWVHSLKTKSCHDAASDDTVGVLQFSVSLVIVEGYMIYHIWTSAPRFHEETLTIPWECITHLV